MGEPQVRAASRRNYPIEPVSSASSQHLTCTISFHPPYYSEILLKRELKSQWLNNFSGTHAAISDPDLIPGLPGSGALRLSG